MGHIIEIQSFARSKWDKSKLCSFDTEVISSPTQPLIHQEARFLFVNKGKGAIVIQGKRYDLKPGAFVAILPWEISEVTEVESPLQYYLLIYHFDTLSQLIKSFYNSDNQPASIIRSFSGASAVYCNKEQTSKIVNIFKDIRDEVGIESAPQFVESQTLSSIYVTNHLVQLIVLFIRIGSNECLQPLRKELVDEEILYYIYTHLNEKVTLKVLSQVFYKSESAISQYIKQMTGLSLNNLCHEMRITKTANYLLYTDLTIDELANILGYADASHISKVFNARIGMKINEYRKTYQKITDICKVKESKQAYSLVSYIYKNHTENLTVQNVSSALGMSPCEMNKILLYQVEKNFDDFFNYVRINHACKLLLTTDKSIVDIAVEVGYHNTKTFTRNFLKWKVMNPSNFRKKVKLQQPNVTK